MTPHTWNSYCYFCHHQLGGRFQICWVLLWKAHRNRTLEKIQDENAQDSQNFKQRWIFQFVTRQTDFGSASVPNCRPVLTTSWHINRDVICNLQIILFAHQQRCGSFIGHFISKTLWNSPVAKQIDCSGLFDALHRIDQILCEIIFQVQSAETKVCW